MAILDSGVNPYHASFTALHEWDPGYPDTFSIPGGKLTTVNLARTGDYESRRETDDAFWNSVQPDTLYAFDGTRLLGVTMFPLPDGNIIEDATIGHGTGTAGLAAREAPRAAIMMVTIDLRACADFQRVDCNVEPSVARGMAWIANQSWIDVVSVSIGLPGNPPSRGEAHPESDAYFSASRRAAQSGKIIVSGAGNSATPPYASYFAGPPWVISAGGFEPGPRGENVAASKGADVVANFTDYHPRAGTLDGYAWGAGTSFATPIVAGTLAAALDEIRAGVGHEGGITQDGALAVGRTAEGRELRVTSRELREALNASALAVSPTEWDPTRPTSNETLYQITGTSAPVTGPAQIGWGYVHAGLAHEIARRVLHEDYAAPAKDITAQWMRTEMDAREAYWANVGT